jgi:hypothetical protein
MLYRWSLIKRYNKRLSTQLFGPLYQFTEDHFILEAAKRVVAAGGDAFKFQLANADAKKRQIQVQTGDGKG